MDLGFTEEQLATLMEGYKAMNGDASASDIVSDLGIQNYVTVSNGEMVSKPAEPVVQTTSTGTTDFGIPDINYVPDNPSTNVNVDLSKVGGDSTTNPTTTPSNPVVDNTTPSTGGKTTETPKTDSTTPSTGGKTTETPKTDSTTPSTGGKTTETPKTDNNNSSTGGNKTETAKTDNTQTSNTETAKNQNATPSTGDNKTTTSPSGGNNSTSHTGSNNSTPNTGSNSVRPSGSNMGSRNRGNNNNSSSSGRSSSSGTGNSTELDVEAIKKHISGTLKGDFTRLKKACSDFANNMNDLQLWFYGPETADCTSAYKAIKEDYSSEDQKGKGIVGSLRSAFDWVDYCDQYISQWEKEQKSGNLWV